MLVVAGGEPTKLDTLVWGDHVVLSATLQVFQGPGEITAVLFS